MSSGAGGFEGSKYGLRQETVAAKTKRYGIGKTAVNWLTVRAVKERKSCGILVNSVCPDATDAGGTGLGRNVTNRVGCGVSRPVAGQKPFYKARPIAESH